MRIRREQEMDYERCLAEDRAKLNEKRRVENEKLLAEKLEAEQKLLEERKKQVIFFFLINALWRKMKPFRGWY